MVTTPNPPGGWWTWQRSVQFRVAWLVGAWVLALGAAWLGPLLWPLAVARFAGSMGQTCLNVRLGRQVPVERARRVDWVLVAAMVVCSYAVAGAVFAGFTLSTTMLVLPPLIPFTLLQVRMGLRSLDASRGETTRLSSVDRMVRVVHRSPVRLVRIDSADIPLPQAA